MHLVGFYCKKTDQDPRSRERQMQPKLFVKDILPKKFYGGTSNQIAVWNNIHEIIVLAVIFTDI
jgi:hypothetical protein